jgi:hypothetical protein
MPVEQEAKDDALGLVDVERGARHLLVRAVDVCGENVASDRGHPRYIRRFDPSDLILAKSASAA